MRLRTEEGRKKDGRQERRPPCGMQEAENYFFFVCFVPPEIVFMTFSSL